MPNTSMISLYKARFVGALATGAIALCGPFSGVWFTAEANAQTPSEKVRREQVEAYRKAEQENPGMDVVVGPDGKIYVTDPQCYRKQFQENVAAHKERRSQRPIPGCVFPPN